MEHKVKEHFRQNRIMGMHKNYKKATSESITKQ